jgi:hypothetical protein
MHIDPDRIASQKARSRKPEHEESAMYECRRNANELVALTPTRPETLWYAIIDKKPLGSNAVH